MRKSAVFAHAAAGVGILSLGLLAGCNDGAPEPQAPLARIDATTAEFVDFAPRATLTGTIMAQVQNDLSFRLSGKIIERNVDVGDHVTADQVLARLDPQTQQADVESAKAGVQSAEAQLKQATATFQRQKTLLDSGFTTRARPIDQAEQSFRTAQASLDSANAQLTSAQDQLNYTILKAGESGMITARYAETGQVVEQARAIFTIAKDGPRDAVFRRLRGDLRASPRRCQSGNYARLQSEDHGGGYGARDSSRPSTPTREPCGSRSGSRRHRRR